MKKIEQGLLSYFIDLLKGESFTFEVSGLSLKSTNDYIFDDDTTYSLMGEVVAIEEVYRDYEPTTFVVAIDTEVYGRVYISEGSLDSFRMVTYVNPLNSKH